MTHTESFHRRPATLGLLVVLVLSACAASGSAACATNVDCSLNGVCTAGACVCDAPWVGPVCGVMAYKTTPASGFSLYPESDPHNTWNGAIIRGPDWTYHLYVPIYQSGTLGGTTTMRHGVSANVTGPYDFDKMPDITIGELGSFDGPKSVVFTDAVTSKTTYSLWLGGGVYLSDSVDGPFKRLEGFKYPGANPAPVWHNNAFFVNYGTTIFTTPRLVSGAQWTAYGTVSHDNLPAEWIAEDPDLYVDTKGNWHIINHAYNPHEWEHCAGSVISTHFFSEDGKTWHFLPQAVQPYNHTVKYDDGTSHMFVTLERPNLFFDENGLLTHIHLAADLVGGDAGCGNRTNHTHFGHCPCDNCKYEDKGGTTIIALGV